MPKIRMSIHHPRRRRFRVSDAERVLELVRDRVIDSMLSSRTLAEARRRLVAIGSDDALWSVFDEAVKIAQRTESRLRRVMK